MARTPRKDTETVRENASGALFLGAVVARRRNGDETPMAAEFSLLLARVNQAMGQYHSQQLSTGEFATALSTARVVDTDGAEWTLGSTSGSWYRRYPGEHWRQVPPPDHTVVARDPLLVSLEQPVGEDAAFDVPPDPFVSTSQPDPEPAEVPHDDDSGTGAAWVSASMPDTDDLDEVTPPLEPELTPPTPAGTSLAEDFDGLGDPYMDVATNVSSDALSSTEHSDPDVELDTDDLMRRWLGTDSDE